jgi:glycosyltransferase involved in cell wall biosynthesis
MIDFRVSVIIPVYNAEAFLEQAVKSALEQKEVAEVVLVEDGSPDNSLDVCLKLLAFDGRVKLIQHPDNKNHGAGATRNLGIKHATMPFIAFLDADDYYLPGRFEKDKEVFSANPDADGIYSAVKTEIFDEIAQKRYANKGLVTTVSEPLEPQDLFHHMAPLGRKGYFHGNGLTVRKEVFDRIGYFNSHLRLSQDTHMFIKMVSVCRLYPGKLEEALSIRRAHAMNRISDKERLLDYRPLLFKSLFEWACDHQLEKSKRLILWQQYVRWKMERAKGSRISKNFTKVWFLFGQGIKKPWLLGTRTFYTAFPIVGQVFR